MDESNAFRPASGCRGYDVLYMWSKSIEPEVSIAEWMDESNAFRPASGCRGYDVLWTWTHAHVKVHTRTEVDVHGSATGRDENSRKRGFHQTTCRQLDATPCDDRAGTVYGDIPWSTSHWQRLNPTRLVASRLVIELWMGPVYDRCSTPTA